MSEKAISAAKKSKKKRADPRSQLVAKKIELEKALGQVRVTDQIPDLHRSGDPADEADRIREATQESASGRARNFRQLNLVIAALGRIEAGTFGICSECGEGINSERLEAEPTTDQCISCLEKAEEKEKLAKQCAGKY